jgi:hypothetical protein
MFLIDTENETHMYDLDYCFDGSVNMHLLYSCSYVAFSTLVTREQADTAQFCPY